MRRERGLSKEMAPDRSTSSGQRTAAVESSDEVVLRELPAVAREMAGALAASAAGIETQDHLLARPDMGDGASHLLNDASPLVPENTRWTEQGVPIRNVRVADAGRHHSNQHLIGLEIA
jgi:hypothetical protein